MRTTNELREDEFVEIQDLILLYSILRDTEKRR